MSVGVYPREEMHDTRVYPDEVLTDVRITASTWPDCYSNETAIRSIFRIEGVADGPADQAKALALWKWFRILMSSNLGGHRYETDSQGVDRIVLGPHRIFTCYGHHQCDGLSWTMVPLWRAAGYMGLDECHFGHTVASLWYRDADGHHRFHDLDPQKRFYYWDPGKKIISTWTMPVMRERVHRHVMQPRHTHTLRTSLRAGEFIVRRWTNEGFVIPPGRQGPDISYGKDAKYYRYREGRGDGVFTVAGSELQEFCPDRHPETFPASLQEGSVNTACTAGFMHPDKVGAPGVFMYRIASPYPAVEATVEAELSKGSCEDRCAIELSIDEGKTWKPVRVLEDAGTETVSVKIGRTARAAGGPNVYTAYSFLLRGVFETKNSPRSVGMRGFRVSVVRQLNRRTLPNLRPHENMIRVDGVWQRNGYELEAAIAWKCNGKIREEKRRIASFPFYFSVDTGAVAETIHMNYDSKFNDGPVQMQSISLRLVPTAEGPADESLAAETGERAFAAAAPHPADMTHYKIPELLERSPGETTGFLPQDGHVHPDKKEIEELMSKLKSGKLTEPWAAAEDLQHHPEALDELIAALPGADIDLTLYICKALAQLKDSKAILALLEKWKEGEKGSPGTRYIPDALAAIGDVSVVPALVKPLKTMRFDFRFHIAYALGRLGGPEARAALEDLAKNDPFPAVRELAASALERLAP